jgi:hypothetical protein
LHPQFILVAHGIDFGINFGGRSPDDALGFTGGPDFLQHLKGGFASSCGYGLHGHSHRPRRKIDFFFDV